MSTSKAVAENEMLAIDGGPKAVTAERPASLLHGPNEIGEEEIAAVTKVLRGKNLFRFFRGEGESTVSAFEELFREKTGAEHVLAVNSGTSALISALVGIGVSHGDEVLVPAYTYIATAAAVLAMGAFPVVVEVDDSLTMDPEDLRRKITPRTTAVIPVHMRGMICNMDAILAVAREHNLKVLEDCAQANGGQYKGRSIGTWGDVGAYSLQHFKIITAGEGGAVVTNHKEVFQRAAVYHDSAFAFWMEKQGTEEEQENWKAINFLGENFRQSELHGAVAYEQLKKRDRILERTRAIKRKLRDACEELPRTQMEKSHDLEGDCGISLAFFVEDKAEAQKLAETLSAEGVPFGTRFSKQVPDRHIFYHWNYIMEKRSPHLNGYPWNSSNHPCKVEYSKEMCPQTLDYMERLLMMSISQTMSDEYVDQLCQGIRKVARAW